MELLVRALLNEGEEPGGGSAMTIEKFQEKYGKEALALRFLLESFIKHTAPIGNNATMAKKIMEMVDDLESALREYNQWLEKMST